MSFSSQQIEVAARAAHEVNRAYCREVLDDFSPLQWKDVPEWQREAVLAGVRAIAENPALTPADGHELWMSARVAEGWVWGRERSLGMKTHPCLVAFEQLPLAQRVKDTLFGVVVRAALGLEHNVAIDISSFAKVGK